MNKTGIEWTDFSWNPVTGCLNGCSYCYARELAGGRLKGRYLANKNVMAGDRSDPFAPRSWPARFAFRDVRCSKTFRSHNPGLPVGSAMIFTVDMGDLFGPWVEEDRIMEVIDVALNHPQHIFQFLTKCPENLEKWNPWPVNCWVGATATDEESMLRACLLRYVDVPVKFVSFEPLLGAINGALWPNPSRRTRDTFTPDWVIVGGQTGPGAAAPRAAWVKDIIDSADLAGVPIFLKDNLKWPAKRQEWPTVEYEAVEQFKSK